VLGCDNPKQDRLIVVNEDGFRFEARGRVIHAGAVKHRRVFTWRNLVRRPPRTANQPGCPLQVIRPRLYSYASLGSRIGTSLRFDLRNISDKTIHSYFWRYASPVTESNGGFGCEPEGGLSPDNHQHETAHLAWRGPVTITIDFVQFLDGDLWLSFDPQSSVTLAGLHAGSRRAADHLLRVWRGGGMESLADALPCIHRDVQETAAAARERGERPGPFSFYAGVTRATVMVRSISAENVEETLLALRSAGA
jgi:hypothetical protein